MTPGIKPGILSASIAVEEAMRLASIEKVPYVIYCDKRKKGKFSRVLKLAPWMGEVMRKKWRIIEIINP